MTISSEVNRSGPYACNGATTIFPFGFKIFDAAHIRVVKTDADGKDKDLTLGADYAVSGVGSDGGGQIKTTVAHPPGNVLTLLLNVSFTQQTDLENQGAYFAETIERALDMQTQMVLQLKEQVARSVAVSPSKTVDRSLDDVAENALRAKEYRDDAANSAALSVSSAATAVARANDAGTSAAVAANQAAAAHSSAESAATAVLALSGALTNLAGAFSVDADGHLNVTYADTAVSAIQVDDATGHLLISYGAAA